MKFVCKSEAETSAAGEKFGALLRGGDIVLLSGELGAGKTVFTKGIAKALGVKESVLSPTFTIMNEYDGEKLRLCHFDAYRLRCGDDVVEVGLAEDIGEKNTVCVIEWFENIADILPANNVKKVTIRYLGEDEREIEISDDK